MRDQLGWRAHGEEKGRKGVEKVSGTIIDEEEVDLAESASWDDL